MALTTRHRSRVRGNFQDACYAVIAESETAYGVDLFKRAMYSEAVAKLFDHPAVKTAVILAARS
jgi:hypothetical protein